VNPTEIATTRAGKPIIKEQSGGLLSTFYGIYHASRCYIQLNYIFRSILACSIKQCC